MERNTGYAIKVTGGNYAYYKSKQRIGFSEHTYNKRLEGIMKFRQELAC